MAQAVVSSGMRCACLFVKKGWGDCLCLYPLMLTVNVLFWGGGGPLLYAGATRLTHPPVDITPL